MISLRHASSSHSDIQFSVTSPPAPLLLIFEAQSLRGRLLGPTLKGKEGGLVAGAFLRADVRHSKHSPISSEGESLYNTNTFFFTPSSHSSSLLLSFLSSFPPLPEQVAAAQYPSDPNNNNSSDNSNPSSSPRKKRPYHKRYPFDDETRQGQGQQPQPQPQPPPTTTMPAPPPPQTTAAAANLLEPHQKLEAVTARLAASVSDASELVSAARMLQSDGERMKARSREEEREEGCPPFFFFFFFFSGFVDLAFFPLCKKPKNTLPQQEASLPRCSGSSPWP